MSSEKSLFSRPVTLPTTYFNILLVLNHPLNCLRMHWWFIISLIHLTGVNQEWFNDFIFILQTLPSFPGDGSVTLYRSPSRLILLPGISQVFTAIYRHFQHARPTSDKEVVSPMASSSILDISLGGGRRNIRELYSYFIFILHSKLQSPASTNGESKSAVGK